MASADIAPRFSVAEPVLITMSAAASAHCGSAFWISRTPDATRVKRTSKQKQQSGIETAQFLPAREAEDKSIPRCSHACPGAMNIPMRYAAKTSGAALSTESSMLDTTEGAASRTLHFWKHFGQGSLAGLEKPTFTVAPRVQKCARNATRRNPGYQGPRHS